MLRINNFKHPDIIRQYNIPIVFEVHLTITAIQQPDLNNTQQQNKQTQHQNKTQIGTYKTRPPVLHHDFVSSEADIFIIWRHNLNRHSINYTNVREDAALYDRFWNVFTHIFRNCAWYIMHQTANK